MPKHQEIADAKAIAHVEAFQRAVQINITCAALEQALRVSNEVMEHARKMLRPGPDERELAFRIAVNTELLERIERSGVTATLVAEVEPRPKPTLWRGEPRP